MAKFHRAFGVYGILIKQQQLVVVKKKDGPYKYRYDLPGGSLEPGEFLQNALIREVAEETGLHVRDASQVGVTSFTYPWIFEDFDWNQHIVVLYEVTAFEGELSEEVPQFSGQDSFGAELISVDAVLNLNSSPIVVQAVEYIKNGVFSTKETSFDYWDVLSQDEAPF